ncbi:MAG TPA: hypothetical protein VF194_11875 [Ferrovibrio sp.]|jgi:hypothetical protein|uniref:hypothetical protein n=1 Tax=Ferrovibrio sp. TaxID=1917215 RepID=UPI002ED6BD33
MDLPLDPTLPLGGIAAILLLVWLTGGRRQAAIAGADDAAAALAAPELGFAAGEIAVSQDGRTALARDDGGHVAVVFVSGARLAARKLTAGETIAVTLTPLSDGAVRLTLATRAFTHPDFHLRLDAAGAGRWQRHLMELPQ